MINKTVRGCASGVGPASMWFTAAARSVAYFAFIELHNHASYLDAESIAIDRNVKEFAAGVISRAQRDGLIKPLDTKVLMELVFGAFVGMMRAHWEGRIALTDDVLVAAEQACWDAVAIHPMRTR